MHRLPCDHFSVPEIWLSFLKNRHPRSRVKSKVPVAKHVIAFLLAWGSPSMKQWVSLRNITVCWRRCPVSYRFVSLLFEVPSNPVLPAENLIAQASGDPKLRMLFLGLGTKTSKPHIFSNTNARTDKMGPNAVCGGNL